MASVPEPTADGPRDAQIVGPGRLERRKLRAEHEEARIQDALHRRIQLILDGEVLRLGQEERDFRGSLALSLVCVL